MSADTERIYAAPRQWAHVHPVSPLLGGWALIAGVFGFWFTGGPGASGGGSDSSDGVHLPLARLALVVLAAAVLAVGVGYVMWWFHTYRITDEAIEQRKGVVFRQHLQARLDRIQAVDVVQPLLGRIFGFGKVSIEVAGGANSAIHVQYLRLADAEALRNEVLALAAGYSQQVSERVATVPTRPFGLRDELDSFRLAPAPGSAHTAVGAAAERELVRVPIKRLLMSMVLSWGMVVFVVVVAVAVVGAIAAGASASEQTLAAAVGGGLASVMASVFGFASVAYATLNRGMNFRLGISLDGVRVTHGLLETRRQTVPPGRVQAVRLRQPLLWRRRDWWQIVINVAGYQENQVQVSFLLPVGTRDEALLALWTVLPDLGEPDPQGMVSRALSGTGAEGGFITSPSTARWLDPLQWRQRGVHATSTALFIRRGRLVRELTVVAHERTQSLALTQGPLERVLGLANVEVHSTVGMVRPIAAHLAVAHAVDLLDAQAQRARQRRRVQTPQQWMAQVGLTQAGSTQHPGGDDGD